MHEKVLSGGFNKSKDFGGGHPDCVSKLAARGDERDSHLDWEFTVYALISNLYNNGIHYTTVSMSSQHYHRRLFGYVQKRSVDGLCASVHVRVCMFTCAKYNHIHV